MPSRTALVQNSTKIKSHKHSQIVHKVVCVGLKHFLHIPVYGTHRSAGLGRTRLFHPWGREPEGGWSGSDVSVSHVVGPSQGSGLMGWVGSRWVPSGLVEARRGPVWVRISGLHRYGSIECSVRARRVPSGHIGHIGQSSVRSKNIKFGPKWV